MFLLACAPNEDSDQTAHSRGLIRVFVVSRKKLGIVGYPKFAQWRFWSDYANAQADLNLRWAHKAEGTLSEALRHVVCIDQQSISAHICTRPLVYLTIRKIQALHNTRRYNRTIPSYAYYIQCQSVKYYIEGWAQDCRNSNIFLKPLFRGNLDPFVNNANLGAIAHTSNGT